VIAPRHAIRVVHPLLDDAPAAAGNKEERVVIELVTVLHGSAVDLRRHAARVDERTRVNRQRIAIVENLARRAA